MGGQARVGCSGWMYKPWRGVVYPEGLPQRRWFEHYATLFDTVELNTTFYRLPTGPTVDRWRDQAPDGFVYAVKVGAFGSHRMKLRDAESWLSNHLERALRLGPHLGPHLLQLPPRWRRDVERLDEFLSVAPGDQRWAVELREPSWVHDDVFDVLARHGAALCLHDLLPGQPLVRTTDWTYLRFHGPEAPHRPYAGRYGPAHLAPMAELLGTWLAEGCDVYAYFNNDIGAEAVHDAGWLRSALEGERQVSPP
jgi:uncharacterized protein YecE (DUF72 family)